LGQRLQGLAGTVRGALDGVVWTGKGRDPAQEFGVRVGEVPDKVAQTIFDFVKQLNDFADKVEEAIKEENKASIVTWILMGFTVVDLALGPVFGAMVGALAGALSAAVRVLLNVLGRFSFSAITLDRISGFTAGAGVLGIWSAGEYAIANAIGNAVVGLPQTPDPVGMAITRWCAIRVWPCSLGCSGVLCYRSAQRSDTSPAMASMVSSKCSRRPM
jgi:hypothetical protein